MANMLRCFRYWKRKEQTEKVCHKCFNTFFNALVQMSREDLDELGMVCCEAMERSLTPMHLAKIVFTMCETERQVVHDFLVDSGILKRTRAQQLFKSVSTILDFVYRAQEGVKSFTSFFGFEHEKNVLKKRQAQKKREDAPNKKMKKLYKTKTLQLHDPEAKRIMEALSHPDMQKQRATKRKNFGLPTPQEASDVDHTYFCMSSESEDEVDELDGQDTGVDLPQYPCDFKTMVGEDYEGPEGVNAVNTWADSTAQAQVQADVYHVDVLEQRAHFDWDARSGHLNMQIEGQNPIPNPKTNFKYREFLEQQKAGEFEQDGWALDT